MAVFSAIGAAISGIVSAVGSAIGAVGSALGGLTGGGLLGGLSAAAGLAGTALSYMGQRKAAKGAERAEALRQRQMNLEAARSRRGTVRQAIIARAQALSRATSQGAEAGSGLAGGLAQISGQAASNVQGINQGQQIGAQMFAANRQISTGQTYQSIGGAFQGLGSFIAQNAEPINRVFGVPA